MTIQEMLDLLNIATSEAARIVCRVDGFEEPGIEIEPNEVFAVDGTVYVDFCRKLGSDAADSE